MKQSKIGTIEEAVQEANTQHKNHKKIVVTGGCFDIVHTGHVSLLEHAKAAGDFLIVFLESNETVKKLKGENRPINSQNDRAKVLAAFTAVDFVVLLPPLMSNIAYDDVIFRLKPDIIAITKGDQHRLHKERQAMKVHAQIYEADIIANQGTTKIAALLTKEL